MTAAVLQGRVVDADALLGDYLDHVAGLGLSGRAVRDRTRIAREFLSRHPDLDAWMDLPAAERAADLRSTGAWPLLCYAIGTGRVRLDVELAAVKQLTGLGGAVEARDPSRVRGAAGGGKPVGLDAVPGSKRCSASAWRWCWPGTAGWSPTSPRM